MPNKEVIQGFRESGAHGSEPFRCTLELFKDHRYSLMHTDCMHLNAPQTKIEWTTTVQVL